MFTLDDLKHTRVYQEALEEGEQRGFRQGRKNEARSLLLRQLSKKLGNLSPRYRTQIKNLTLKQMQTLCEALLDFTTIADLDLWLKARI
jgi:predicted transposase YdaD